MLSIYLGDCENEIYNPPLYFINQYEDFWLESELAKKMIKDLDKSEVVGPHLIQSPVLGPISPRELSGGVKTLLLLAFDNSGKIFNATACGDNCAKWILEIGKRKDITVYLEHWMDFKGDFEIQFMNNGHIVHNAKEYCDALIDFDYDIDVNDNIIEPEFLGR